MDPVLESELLNFVKGLTDDSLNDREQKKFDEELENLEKRFEAMRSVRGLDYKDLPKTSPWPGCSDIGIPIEAITIQSIVARTDRTEFERLPLTHVTPVGPSDVATAPKVEAFLDWQKLNLMRVRIPKLMATRAALTLGSYFFKVVFEEKYVWDEEDVYGLRDPDTGEVMKDEGGRIVQWDPEGEQPLNDSLKPYQIVPLAETYKKDTYRGPVLYGRHPKNILWSKDETSYDPADWDWWADLYERSVEWLDTKGREQGYINVDQIIAKLQLRAFESGAKIDRKRMVKLREWHGEYDVAGNGKMRCVTAIIAPEYNVFLGWEKDKVKQKTGEPNLIHRCPIPMEGRVLGQSIPRFIKGLRDAIDGIFNSMLDQASRKNNPPIIYAHGSGFDPGKHNFGYRFWPEKTPGTLRELAMAHNDNIEVQKIQLLMELVQRLFGVSDSTLGADNPKNQTYGGITTLLAEGNVNIDMLIQTMNESNIRLDELIISLNAIYIRRDEEGQGIPLEFPLIDDYSSVMEDPDNPFATITEEELLGRYNFMPTGASLTINTRSIREEAGFLFEKVMTYMQVNPFLQDLNVVRESTSDVFKSFGKKNIQLPSVEEVQMKMAQAAQMAAQAATAQPPGKKGPPNAGRR
jgi:hypothetical protein